MSSEQYSNELLSAMSIIANRAVETAGYDKTIKATIVQCQDATIERYKVQYQDGYWTAYGNGAGVSYTKGTPVYILIPNGDMSQRKTILGSVKQLGINYINIPTQENKYSENGNNILTKQKSKYELCSYKTEKQVIFGGENNTDDISISLRAASTYIKQSSHLKCSFRVQTKIPIDQRYSGNYGIKFYLDFKDRTTNSIVTRQYIFDTYLMTGNPYLYNNTVLQTASFQIDGPRFEKISKIELFVENFPNAGTGIQPNDIFISNLDIKGVTLLSQEQMDKVSLSFVAKKGYIFTDNGNKDQSRKIQAVVRVLGKTVTDVAGQDLKFYWFVQNISITQNSIYYNKYGGSGWRCLNKYKVLKTNEGKPTKIEFNSGSSSFSVKKEDVLIKNQKYKCVVLYGDTILQKEFTMINDAAGYTINITSDKGTSFTLDSGYPNLTCKISDTNGKVPSGIKYHWGVVNYQGVFSNLIENSVNYKEWQTNLTDYNELKNNLNNKTIYKNSKYKNTNEKNIDVYNKLKNQIKTWNKTEIVYQNFIYHVNIKNIVNFSTFICTVIDKNANVIGSAEITLTNKSSSNGGYFLRLNNGKQVFNYNQQGLSPCKNPKVKYVIPELSFSLYNDKNQEIDQDEINMDNIKWFIPNPNNSLLTCNYKNGETSGDMIIYSGRKTFIYGISNRYIRNHNINNIQLQVKYHGYTLTAETNFTFTKQGYSGTNGTGVTVRIVPIDINEVEINQLPYYYNNETNFDKLITEVYKGGEKIAAKNYSCVWSTLINKNSKKILTIDKNNAITGLTLSSCEIIKVAVSMGGKTIYATLPIIYCKQKDEYRISLKQNTGYQYVYYAEDGTNPQYDNKYPFTFIIEKEINDILQDVSTNTQFIKDDTFEYSTFGNLTNIENISSKQNSIKIEPASYYNGDNVINYVECVVYENKKNVATCRVPIHMMLNRYGHAALNDWDGNSIDIGQQTILAPQVGAGQKETDNSFTGILIGSVKDNHKGSISNGLFGYSGGKRTIFLNSDSGKATFGLDKQGQIEIDGKSAIITGGDYQLKDEKKKIAGSGMQINLREPFIKFGNEKFSVNKNGALISTKGEIAGWNIDEDDLTKDTVGMSSDSSKKTNIAFWAGNKDRTKAPFKVDFNGALTSISGKIAGWNISENSLTKGKVGISSDNSKDTNIAFWAGSSDSTKAPFRVDFGGNLVINSGKIGRGSYPIYIGGKGSYESGTLYSGTHNKLNSTVNGFYLGTDGISFGGFFKMDATGNLTAKSGKIANWNFDANAIYNDEAKKYSKPAYTNDKGAVLGRGIYFGKGGLRMGGNFHVNENGDLYARSGYFQGTLYSSEGKIGGWEIKPTLLKGGNMQINSNGSMKGSNWSIDSNGKASFSNMNISGGKMSGGTIGGSSKMTGGSISPGSVGVPGYNNLQQWCNNSADNRIKALFVEQLDAHKAHIAKLVAKSIQTGQLKISGTRITWNSMSVGIDLESTPHTVSIGGQSITTHTYKLKKTTIHYLGRGGRR